MSLVDGSSVRSSLRDLAGSCFVPLELLDALALHPEVADAPPTAWTVGIAFTLEALRPHAGWMVGRVARAATWPGMDLRGAPLDGADLRGAVLRHCDLRGASLRCADLRWADLRGARLDQARLDLADLQGANLWLASLRHAVLAQADLRSASVIGADLTGAVLPSGAFLRGCRHGRSRSMSHIDPGPTQVDPGVDLAALTQLPAEGMGPRSVRVEAPGQQVTVRTHVPSPRVRVTCGSCGVDGESEPGLLPPGWRLVLEDQVAVCPAHDGEDFPSVVGRI